MNGFSELAGLAGGRKWLGKFERMMLRRAKLGLQRRATISGGSLCEANYIRR